MVKTCAPWSARGPGLGVLAAVRSGGAPAALVGVVANVAAAVGVVFATVSVVARVVVT